MSHSWSLKLVLYRVDVCTATRRILVTRLLLSLLTLSLFLPGWMASALGAELDQIRRRGHLIVAVKENLRPLGFRDAAGELQGLEIDLARQLAQDLLGNREAILFKPVTNQERLAAVTSGEVDLAIANITATDNRRRIVDFSSPYYFSHTSILTQVPQRHSLSQFNQRRVAVLQRSRTIAILRSAVPKAILVGVNSYQQAKTLLDQGEVVAFAGDHAVLVGWSQEDPTYRPLPIQLSSHGLAIALPKGLQFQPLRQRVNQSLQQWQTQGWLQERIQVWGLEMDAAVQSQKSELSQELTLSMMAQEMIAQH